MKNHETEKTMTEEAINALEAALIEKREEIETAKTVLPEADELRRQWDAYVKQLRAEHKAALKEAIAGFDVAKTAAKEKRDVVKELEAEARGLRKQIKLAKKGGSVDDVAEEEPKKKEPDEWKLANTNNGVTRPRPGTIGGQVWDIADRISAETKAPATFAAVREAAGAVDITLGTVSGNYAHWRAFYGLPPHMKSPDEADAVANESDAVADEDQDEE